MSVPNNITTMESVGGAPHAMPLDHRLSRDTNAVEVAKAAVAAWRDVDVALRPIIGQRGVNALFDRSVHLTAAAHPWLVPDRRDSAADLDLSALESLLSQQTSATALSCGNALLLTFHRLLVSLIGSALTERLLRPTWTPQSGGTSMQESSS